MPLLLAVLVAIQFCCLLPSAARADGQAAKTAALIAEGWHHRVWLLYPPEKVKADETLPTERKVEAIRLSVAQGEHEPFIILVRAEVALRDVKLEFADLRGPGGSLSAASFEARRMAYIYVDEPSGTRIKGPMPFETGTGLYPDPLPKGDGFTRPGRNLQFWVTAHVPRGAKPGRYEGSLALRFRKEGWMPEDKVKMPVQLPVAVTVRNFALPERSPLLNTAFFAPARLTRERRDPEWLKAFYRDFIAHRQTPEPVLPSPVLQANPDGTMTVDSTEWEKTAAFFFDELKASHVFLPVWGMHPEPTMLQGVYFIWHFPATTKQRWFGPFIADDSRQLTPEFKKLFGSYLKHIHGVLKQRGWLGRVFITTMDEPYTYHTADRKLDIPANNYQVVRNFVTFVRETAPGLKTFATADPTPELNGYVDHWCLRNLKLASAARERAEKHRELVTFCDNYRTFIDFPLVSSRTLGWLAWKLGARGWLTYETMGGFGTAWEGPVTVYPQFGAATVWGLGQMFYPEPGTAGVVPSLRWEMMREGAEDYEYLWLLRERLKALPASQQGSDAAQQARTLLETAAAQVVGGSGDPETASASAPPNTQSNLVPHELRGRIGDLIEQLAAAQR
ncbi:MAG: DUF4091 domain-containing protein [Planctomycetes bacterium]|nr:DUF4091 domain-containing protein [Planctomycetota bacterium]